MSEEYTGLPHNSVVAFKYERIKGLKHSFQEIVRRHQDLRTTFAVVDGQPVQVIAAQHDLRVQSVDLRDRPALERNAQALQLARQEAQRPFDLCCGPLMRITLYSLSEEEHILVIIMHHIITDAWSTAVMWRELTTYYNAFVSGMQASLPELAVQYADFAYWQRQ